jgi:hypothetical protein
MSMASRDGAPISRIVSLVGLDDDWRLQVAALGCKLASLARASRPSRYGSVSSTPCPNQLWEAHRRASRSAAVPLRGENPEEQMIAIPDERVRQILRPAAVTAGLDHKKTRCTGCAAPPAPIDMRRR